MRFLANENFPGAAVSALKAAGHDIVRVRTAAPGTTDSDVLIARSTALVVIAHRVMGQTQPLSKLTTPESSRFGLK